MDVKGCGRPLSWTRGVMYDVAEITTRCRFQWAICTALSFRWERGSRVCYLSRTEACRLERLFVVMYVFSIAWSKLGLCLIWFWIKTKWDITDSWTLFESESRFTRSRGCQNRGAKPRLRMPSRRSVAIYATFCYCILSTAILKLRRIFSFTRTE